MKKSHTPLFCIKDALEKAGFETSWQRPFLLWLHPEWRADDTSEEHGRTTLYISNILVPKVVPVDVAEAEIKIDGDRLNFCFTLYFYTALKDAIEEEEFRNIYETHDIEWFPKLREYFFDVSSRFSLHWDVEYDESIEDSLYGNFSIGESNRIA